MSKVKFEINSPNKSNSDKSITLPAEIYQSSSKHLNMMNYSYSTSKETPHHYLNKVRFALISSSNTEKNVMNHREPYSVQKAYSSNVITLKELGSSSQMRKGDKTLKNKPFRLFTEINDNEAYSLSDVSSLDLNNSLDYVSEGDVGEEVFDFN